MTAAKIFTTLCLLAVGALLWAIAGEGEFFLRASFKLLASASFIAVALALAPGKSDGYGLYLFLGLCLGAAGDAALLLTGETPFLIGLVFFLLGHICYILAAARLAPVRSWFAPAALPGGIAVLLATIAALYWLWPHLGERSGPVVVYVATLCLMVCAALAAGRNGPRDAPYRLLLPIGAVLFFASDFSVARDAFVKREFANSAWGLPAYYVAQLLIAWSTRAADTYAKRT